MEVRESTNLKIFFADSNSKCKFMYFDCKTVVLMLRSLVFSLVLH